MKRYRRLNGRDALLRTVATAFNIEMAGLYRWGYDTTLSAPEAATEKDPDRPLRNTPFGRHREVVMVGFAKYHLAVHSTSDAPPVGKIKLSHPGGEIEGPLDQQTWKEIGRIVKEAEQSHGTERRSAERPRLTGVADPIPGWGTDVL